MVNSEEEKFQEAYHRSSTFSSKNLQTLPNNQSVTPNIVYASQMTYDETCESFERTCQYKCCI